MTELLIIAVVVVLAAAYAWKKLSAEVSGKESCCEQSEDCSFRDFISKEGKAERLNCSADDRKKRLAGNKADHSK